MTTHALVSGDGRQLGDADVAPDAKKSAAVGDAVAVLLSGSGGIAQISGLAFAGVGYLVVDAPVDSALERTLDGVPGLLRVSSIDSGAVWRIIPAGSRVQLIRAGESPVAIPADPLSRTTTVDTDLPATGAPAALYLTEAADPGWRATADGVSLAGHVAGGWAQGFVVPASARHVKVTYRSSRSGWLALQALVVAVVVVLALPTRRRRGLGLEGEGDDDLLAEPVDESFDEPEHAPMATSPGGRADDSRGAYVRLPRPTVALAAVTVIVLGSVAVAARGSAAEHSAGNLGATTEPISSVELVCPVARSTKNVAQAVLSAAAPTISSVGGSGDGTISVYPVSATPRSVPLAAAARGSSVLHYPVPVGNVGPLEVRATGGYARGLTASVTTLTAAGAGRSLQTEQCTPSGGEGWFVGGGAAIGRRAVLYVTNIDTAPATVDVTVYTARGAQQPTPVQGRTIGPGRQFAIGIDALVPGATATAVHVLTRSGRVSAAVYDSQVNGLIAQGADWVPPTTAPTRDVVLTGIPGDPGALRTLGVVVPGPDDAVLNVHLVTADGTLARFRCRGSLHRRAGCPAST